MGPSKIASFLLNAAMMASDLRVPHIDDGGIAPRKPQFSGGYTKGAKLSNSEKQKKKRKRSASKASRKNNR